MKKFFSLSIFIFIGTFFYAQVEVYTDCNYRGTKKTLTSKSYYTSTQIGLKDNTISAIKITPGYTVTVYTNANMKGRKVVFTESVSCLPAVFNNAISSIVVTKNKNDSPSISNSGNVSLYRSCNYRGSVVNLKPGTYNDLRAQLNGGTPESIQIPKGLVIEFYSERNLKGKIIMRYNSNQDCLPSSVTNTAKSIKIYSVQTQNTKPQPRS